MQPQNDISLSSTGQYLFTVFLAFFMSWAIAGIPRSINSVEINLCIFQIFVAIHFFSYTKENKKVNSFSYIFMWITVVLAVIAGIMICAGQDAFSYKYTESGSMFLLFNPKELMFWPYIIVGSISFFLLGIHAFIVRFNVTEKRKSARTQTQPAN